MAEVTTNGGSAAGKEPLVALVRQLRAVEQASRAFDLSGHYREALAWSGAAQVEQDTLKKLRSYARAQMSLEGLIGEFELLTKMLKEKFKELTERTIPEVMASVEMDELQLSDGHKLVVATSVHANFPKDKVDEGCRWLAEHGSGAIIAHTVTVSLGIDQSDKASKVLEALKPLGVRAEEKRAVHPSTLSAWVREALMKGTEFDLELFGVHRKTASIIKETK